MLIVESVSENTDPNIFTASSKQRLKRNLPQPHYQSEALVDLTLRKLSNQPRRNTQPSTPCSHKTGNTNGGGASMTHQPRGTPLQQVFSLLQATRHAPSHSIPGSHDHSPTYPSLILTLSMTHQSPGNPTSF